MGATPFTSVVEGDADSIVVENPDETVYFDHNFEDGTLGPFTAKNDGASDLPVASQEEAPPGGTWSAKCKSTGGGNSFLSFTYTDNPPVDNSKGLYQRWQWMYTTGSTQNAADGLNSKVLLNRYAGGQGGGAWLMISHGSASSNHKRIVAVVDDGIVTIPDDACPGPGGRSDLILADNVWYTFETWFLYDTVANKGRAKLWIKDQHEDGCQFDFTHADLGSDAFSTMPASFGIVHMSSGIPGPVVMHVAEIRASDTFMEL